MLLFVLGAPPTISFLGLTLERVTLEFSTFQLLGLDTSEKTFKYELSIIHKRDGKKSQLYLKY